MSSPAKSLNNTLCPLPNGNQCSSALCPGQRAQRLRRGILGRSADTGYAAELFCISISSGAFSREVAGLQLGCVQVTSLRCFSRHACPRHTDYLSVLAEEKLPRATGRFSRVDNPNGNSGGKPFLSFLHCPPEEVKVARRSKMALENGSSIIRSSVGRT